ncbi:MAG: methylenetetrahydrofolate reductase C-terminal domain-containing protein [Thermoguttaceae bacterium]|jgi:methylenetetrahydrofolate reductase (NADPH)
MASNDGVSFKEMLLGERFYYGVEVVTTRGFQLPDAPNNLASFARDLLGDSRVGWISVTDNPGGGPMLPPDWLGGVVADRRDRVVLHMTCKDLNRNGLEAAAWRYAAEGFHNILAITGDYPTSGFGGLAEPVFDLDSVALITMLQAMNEGLKVPGRSGKIETLPKTDFFIGCAVSPFKRHERELLPQYFKLIRKIACGAQWVIPQLGYDMRKFDEVKLFLDVRGIDIPLIGNVYLLSRGVAKMFHSGKLAGCVVTDNLLETVEKYAAGADKGKKFFLELAAKQLAVLKGLGFAAGYIGGMAKAETFGAIIDTAESFAPGDWRDFIKEIQYSQPDEFFLFEHDPSTGLCESHSINREYLESLRHPKKSKEVTLNYRLSRLVHNMAFTRDKALYPILKKIFSRLDKKPGFLSRMAYSLEKASKSMMYGCQDCGDCSLPDCAYICPKKWCSKCGRNGPCGGSAGGRCELDDKECIWARIYERLKYYGETEQMLERPVTLYNATLKNTSSWANTFLDRDHNALEAPKELSKENNH